MLLTILQKSASLLGPSSPKTVLLKSTKLQRLQWLMNSRLAPMLESILSHQKVRTQKHHCSCIPRVNNRSRGHSTQASSPKGWILDIDHRRTTQRTKMRSRRPLSNLPYQLALVTVPSRKSRVRRLSQLRGSKQRSPPRIRRQWTLISLGAATKHGTTVRMIRTRIAIQTPKSRLLPRISLRRGWQAFPL